MELKKKRVHLTKRLEAIADMIEDSDIVADIGCDHARLAVSLLQRDKTNFVVASDISPHSINKAKGLCRKCGLYDRMRFVVAYGLNAIANEQVDTIVIAGMGGILIAEILQSSSTTAKKAKKIIMQPMRSDGELRKYLYENRFHINNERIVFEERRAYPIISANYTGEYDIIPDFFPKNFFDVSYLLANNKDKDLLRYLYVLKQRLQLYISKANGASLHEYEYKLKSINEIIEYCNGED